MAFSQSFEFGNSTFLNIEKQVNNAINENVVKENQILDIIQESPTKNFKNQHTTLLSKSRSNVRMNGIKKKSFRKSKSDSKLPRISLEPKSESYSDFFRSEFTFAVNEQPDCVDSKDLESLVNVSSIEAAYKEEIDNTNQIENNLNVMEKVIFSEDIKMALQPSEEWSDKTGQLNGVHQTFKDTMQQESADELVQHDECSFLCPRINNEEGTHEIIELQKTFVASAFEDHKIPTMKTRILKEKSHTTITDSCATQEAPSLCNKVQDMETLKSLAAWNLPNSVLKEYKRKGVVKMFDWQVQCLSNPKVLFEHRNLVYSAPTSAGKTLVSEILLLKTVLERQKKVLVILPFISVVREKMFYLQDLLTPAGYRVEGFFGGYTPAGGFESINVAICTIEKANSIVNKLLEQGKLDEIGTVVVDEVHLISDPGRGYILELLLAKVMYMSRKYMLHIQVITMSATLANVQLLQRWLDAELFITDFRPVELKEMIKVANKIYDSNMQLIRDVRDDDFPELQNDSDHIAQLCIETILEDCSVIVFCPSKDWCENLAKQLAGAIHNLGKTGNETGKNLRTKLNREAIDDVKKQLHDIPTGLDAVLEKTITFGCAFHHAGLTTEERDIIESSFKNGALKIIVATSTLSSGVNLPARRVLIRSPLFGGKPMSSLTYKQMIGRAGRTGRDTLGESILICTESNARVGRELITATLRPISSCLEMDSSTHLKRALLEVVSAGVASSKDDIESFFNCTLLSAQKELEQISSQVEGESFVNNESFINKALEFLVEYEFIRLQKNEGTEDEVYVATRLGNACLASSMPPTDGLILFAELQKARRCFVLESELHAVYLVTPYSVCYQLQELDWLFFLDLWEKLTPTMKKVGELVGVKESFLVRAMRGQTKLDYKLMQIHKRFYTSLALQELVNETPLSAVALKYKCNRGMLQGLQQMASTFAGIVSAFCNSLQWDTLSLIVSQFKERLYFGIHRDLIDLMRIPNLTQKRARTLFDAGITSLVELANADIMTIEKILHNSLSFDSEKQHEHEDSFEAEKRKEIRNFFITGRAGISIAEAAKMLVLDARQFVQYEIGVDKIKWTQESHQHVTNADEIHMSCEEVCERTPPKRKERNEETDEVSTSPKTFKLDKPEILKASRDEVKPIQNQITTCYKESLQRKEESENSKKNLTENKNEKVNFEKELAKDRNVLTNQIKNEVRTREGDNKKLIATKDQESHTSKNNRSNEKDKLKNSIKEGMKGAVETPVDSSTKASPKTTNEKPTTSKEARKILIEEKRKQALLLKNKRLGNVCVPDNELKTTTPVTDTNKENMIATSKNVCNSSIKQSSPQSCSLVKKHTQNQSPFVTPKEKDKVLKNIEIARKQSIPKEKTPKATDVLPRRSPRNHPTTSTAALCQNGTQNAKDMFMNDSDFELNSGINTALAGDNFENKSFDEIPGSQQMAALPCDATRTPHSSRFLRANRTQRFASPKLKPKIESKPASKEQESLQSSISMALSDISLESSLIKNPFHLNASHILSCSKADTGSSSFKCVEILDICGDQQLFKGAFKEIVASKRFGFCIGLQQQCSKRKPLIGGNLLLNQEAAKENAKSSINPLFLVDDIAYIEGIAFCLADNIVYYMNMQDAGTCKGLTAEIKCKYLRMLLKNSDNTLIIFDAKDQLKILHSAIPNLGELGMNIEDPKVANWLLQPDTTSTMHYLAQQFSPECKALVNLCGSGRGYSSFGLDYQSAILSKVRCSIESCVVIHILKGQIENLERIGNGQLHKFFIELEMPLQISLCNMEVYGFPVNEQAISELYQKMVETLKKLETKIYELHGSRFNLGPSSAVGRVLGLYRKSNGRISTSKQILEKIDTPISQMIINYRKLSVTLTKNIQPLLKCIKTGRIHGQSITFTATGRISMVDPNLQNVAKDYIVEIGQEKLLISCRSVFCPNDSKRCLISADFCQLEMRILAHLSQDVSLLQVMKSEKDIFIAIAARWNKIAEEKVSQQLRDGTKQICYGIVYGMGMRHLSESLKCSEQEATMVSEQFHAAYPGIRQYADKVVKFARNNGYIETITGRRRYLEHINSAEHNMKTQAERQAINSTIQGSAADIAKSAILRMEKNICKYREKLGLSVNCVRLVLHLHDELIFEVPTEKAKKIAKVMSVTMENCVKLSVPLKVKLKMGRCWSELKEIKL